jgi:hypothetical protein
MGSAVWSLLTDKTLLVLRGKPGILGYVCSVTVFLKDAFGGLEDLSFFKKNAEITRFVCMF